MATNKTPVTEHLATRANSIDFATLGLLLPNPDPILRAQGKSITVYRSMLSDSHIGGCVRRRKSAVQALQWGIDKGQSSSRVAKSVQGMLDGLKLGRIIAQMQECTLFGYQPMEVLWGDGSDGLWVPVDVIAKPPEWYCWDANNEFRWKNKVHPIYGEVVPPFKYLIPRQDPTYKNPYGVGDMAMCYWPLLFKKNGLKFWLAFIEKFGSAFSVGKLPRNATELERQELLDSLEALVQNGVATIPDDGSVELVEMAGKSASADLYEKLVQHCKSEIAIALLGQNQTTEATANKASAAAGLKVTDDLRDGDAEIIADSINELIEWFCEINFGDVPVPEFSFWDQEARDKLKAERDKSNHDAGAQFTNAYWMRAYGYLEGDLKPDTAQSQPTPATPSAPAGPSFSESTVVDPTQEQTDKLVSETAPTWDGMAEQLKALVDKAKTPADLQKSIALAYGDLDSDQLVKLMAAAMALAELKGIEAALNGGG